ncbi:Uncharacterised protein [Mycobacteroides abscessus subsp. abscessus]|nr:Uncharacterised protein [Mycobacteroides abscessus subsp. abscessus]SKT81248.1 Uncharacterised protein [Mycobacteroides abscessus subsp. abscessus]
MGCICLPESALHGLDLVCCAHAVSIPWAEWVSTLAEAVNENLVSSARTSRRLLGRETGEHHVLQLLCQSSCRSAPTVTSSAAAMSKSRS